jgi:hypothetical protein
MFRVPRFVLGAMSRWGSFVIGALRTASGNYVRVRLVERLFINGRGRCSRARALPHCKWRADTFKRVAETGPRLANALGKGRLSLTDFLPEVEK